MWREGRGEWELGMTANMYGVSFWSDENALKLDCGDGCTTPNILKTTKLYALNGWTLWYVKYISIKLEEKILHIKKFIKFQSLKASMGIKLLLPLCPLIISSTILFTKGAINCNGMEWNGNYNTPPLESSIIHQIIQFCLSQWMP